MTGALVLALMLATGAPPADELARARTLITRDLRYEDGIRRLERMIGRADVAPDERAEAYRLLGIAYVATNAPEAAEGAFSALLSLDPDHVLDSRLSPKIRSAFEQARARMVRAPTLEDVLALPETGRLRVSARLVDPQARVRSVQLFVRAAGADFEPTAMVRAEDRWEGAVLLPQLGLLRVDYYLSAIGDQGVVLATVGSPQAPSSLVVERTAAQIPAPAPEPAPQPWYGHWWVWAAGAAVVGAAVASAVVLSSGDPEPPMGTLGPLTLD